jgi:DNA primase
VAILDEDVARVRSEADFVAVAAEHIALKRRGQRYVGLCPFHSEKTPSFSINAAEGLYYCFGCGAKGDVITFVREVEHLDFVEAVERLASRAGIQLRRDEQAGGPDRRRQAQLGDAMEKAVEYYHAQLLSGPESAPARRYLRDQRGYDGDVVRRFKIGWAPDGWDALWRELRLPEEVMKDAGLGYVNDRGRKRDSFRARVMFPIYDPGGRPVAFGGRMLPDATYEGPKYKNSAESPIYSKNRVLYGLNWSKTGIVDSSEVVVCEGYTDVIGMFLAGVPRAVATCGTALADGHFRLLKNFARRVVLAYDADAAGQAAAERFHGWERQYEMDIFVASLPRGADPGDVARTDPDALRAAVEAAQPFMRFRVERVLAARDLTRAEGRARAAEEALVVIADHPHQLVRDQYVTLVAERCRVEPSELRRMINDPETMRRMAAQAAESTTRRPNAQRAVVLDGSVGTQAPGRPGGQRRERSRRGTLVELDALRLAVHRPEEVADRLEEALFGDPLNQSAFVRLAGSQTLHEAVEQAEPEVGALLARLAVEESEEDADETIATLVWSAASRAESELRSESHASEERFAEIAQTLSWLKLEMEALAVPAERVEASRRLVAWLADRGEGSH